MEMDEINEYEISVPWGHVAVKAWGNNKNYPVLVLHGIQDNAASFDFLIPLLPREFYYICVDLPGHGKSSDYPPHLPIHVINYVYLFKVFITCLKKEKFIILSHSFGAQVAIMFTQLYPEYVSKLIIIDTLYFTPFTPSTFKDFVNNLKKLNESYVSPRNKPTYTYKEILKKATENRMYAPITEEVAKALLSRSLQKVDQDKYCLSTEQRLKNLVGPMLSPENIFISLKRYPLLCPTLFIFSEESKTLFYGPYFNPDFTDLLMKTKTVSVEVVKGNHYVHMLHPERVSHLITNFLHKINSRL